MSGRLVDTDARFKLAKLLRHLAAGRISNFDFENKMPNSEDPAVDAIESSIWCFYDDFEEMKFVGKRRLSKDQKHTIARWILFLYTSEPYEWPQFPYPGVRPVQHGFLSRLLGKKVKEEQFMIYGEYSVWPFTDDQNFSSAKKGK